MSTFSEMKLSPGTLDAIAAMGYETPSPIQIDAIPIFLAGRDLIAQARTGTGKTAAFGIPMVEQFRNSAASGPIVLVLVPTRELAIQVAEEVGQIAKGSRLHVVTIYGGVGYGKQVSDLRKSGPMVLVATPGRLIDFMQQGTIRLDGVKMLVLDEADRMLDMGFLPDVERILRAVPKVRQTGMFSATVPEPIKRLISRFLTNPETVKVEAGPTATTLTEQFVIRVEKSEKGRALLTLLEKEKPERGIVFTRTKHLARRLAETLQKHGWSSVPLQGNMSQNQRERAMEAFRNGEARLLVATDVAARGIDIPELSHVINHDIPDEPEAYVHRIGRTGRMGKTGRSFTFLQSDEHRDWKVIEHLAGTTVQRFDLGKLPEQAMVGPDVGRPAVQYKGLDSAGAGGGRGGGGGGRRGPRGGSGGGHQAKKRPDGVGAPPRAAYRGGGGGGSGGGYGGGSAGQGSSGGQGGGGGYGSPRQGGRGPPRSGGGGPRGGGSGGYGGRGGGASYGSRNSPEASYGGSSYGRNP